MLKFQLAEIILTRFSIFYFQKKQWQNHGILGPSKNKYLPGPFLGTYSAWLSHSLHFLTDLEEQKDDSWPAESCYKGSTLILLAVYLGEKDKLLTYFRITLNKN